MRQHVARVCAPIALSLASSLCAACGGNEDRIEDAGRVTDAGDLEGPWENLQERPCPADNELTYESFGGPFLLDYCRGCHSSDLSAQQRQGAPLTVDFDDIGDVRRLASRIWAMAADQNMYMPPVGGPESEVRAQLGQWLACGAPARADL